VQVYRQPRMAVWLTVVAAGKRPRRVRNCSAASVVATSSPISRRLGFLSITPNKVKLRHRDRTEVTILSKLPLFIRLRFCLGFPARSCFIGPVMFTPSKKKNEFVLLIRALPVSHVAVTVSGAPVLSALRCLISEGVVRTRLSRGVL
jgi:hypothetical protein